MAAEEEGLAILTEPLALEVVLQKVPMEHQTRVAVAEEVIVLRADSVGLVLS